MGKSGVTTPFLRLDYGGLGRFCSAHVNLFFISCLLIGCITVS